ncbi:hypothetical protein GCM10025762_54460 [Haloechinothrix salitolerans]
MRLRVADGSPPWWEPMRTSTLDVERADPLARQLAHFRSVITGAERPLVTGREGLATLRATQAVADATKTGDLIASPLAPERVRERCEYLGLSIDLYQPFRDFEAVSPEQLERNLRRARHKFELMRRLGADTVLVCSSVSPDAVDDDDLAAEQLHQLASEAAEHGIRIAYEALAWGRHVNTWQRSWEIVRHGDQRGEYFHCHTELLGSRVFFEVVQRVDGYTGYGAVNAPVRMAAHRDARVQRS